MQKKEHKREKEQEEEVVRIRVPQGNEVVGILEQRLGGGRARVKCLDGKSRLCRVPGRLKRSLWVREGDVLLIEPWQFEGESKGDIVYKYSSAQIAVLEKKGLLKQLKEMEEF